MLRSIAMEEKTYRSFGQCIFCGVQDAELTREHIVPEALTGIGGLVIEGGSCRSCNNYANENYEQKAMQTSFAPVRHMLQLRQKRRGAKKKIRKLPKVSFSHEDVHKTGDEGFSYELPVEHYPPIAYFVIHEPAGFLVGEDKSEGIKSLRFLTVHLGLKRITPHNWVTRLPFVLGSPEMAVAKMAYCYAIAEKGLNYFQLDDLRDLLCGRRDDVFNFVGGPLVDEKLPMLRLHKFYFRTRDAYETVLVHLFASFGGPIYEVVISPRRQGA